MISSSTTHIMKMLTLVFICIHSLIILKSSSAYTIPSWSSFEKSLIGPSDRPGLFDSALQYPKEPPFSEEKPTFFRERHGWCPYSERVWLALEFKGIDYDTVLIDNTGPGRKPGWYGGNTPQMRWPESNSRQSESMDLVHELDNRYPDTPALYVDGVEERISAFRSVFPRGARPSSRAAFLFSWSGEPLFRTEFERVLQDTDDLLGESDGPFFCGDNFSAADVAWAPFLERYAAQLPCLHENLNPRDASLYPNLFAWYEAMYAIPAYACRVKGDASSWRKVLNMAGFGNVGTPPTILSRIDDANKAEQFASSIDGDDSSVGLLWDEYSESRPFVAKSASAEAAATICRNREAIARDIAKNAPLKLKNLDADLIDESLRALMYLLTEDNAKEEEEVLIKDVPYVTDLACFLDKRMCVPRDMGALSAKAIKHIAGLILTD